jgi:hypothetical protein
MLSVTYNPHMLSVAMLNAIMLSVVAPRPKPAQVEHITGALLKGWLVALPADIRIGLQTL